MVNVKAEVKGNKLVLEVNLDEEVGASNSGKNLLIGTTQGNQKVQYKGKEIGYGLNVWKKPEPK